MSKFAESVKAVSSYMRENRRRNVERGQTEVAEKLENFATQLDAAYDYVVRLEGLTSALPPDLGNIHDLPAELLGELSVAKTDELEDQIVTVINAYGGEATLDQILVGLYRKFKIIQKRRFMQNKLYRMQMVWSVEGRKGVYTTTEPEEDDLSDLLSQATEETTTERDESDEIPF